MFADDKRAAGLGPSAHEASDFMPTRESLSDNEQLLPGGYADDHWRNEHKRVADEKAAEEKRKKEEAERLHRESLPVSIWKENGGPLAGGAADADITKKTYTENEFVMNFLQQKNRMKMELPAQFNRGL